MKEVSAIVPAYNEANNIGPVLAVLASYPHFAEVIVVDDASTDETGVVVQQYPTIRYLRNEQQLGKGLSLDRGVAAAQADLLFFCDADLRGLTHQMIDELLSPVLNGEAEMAIAIRGRQVPWITTFLGWLFPATTLLAGERTLTRSLWLLLPEFYKQGFRVETGLNFYAQRHGGFVYVPLPQLRQRLKEQKYGFITGLKRRLHMFSEVLSAHWRLRFIDRPHAKAKDTAGIDNL